MNHLDAEPRTHGKKKKRTFTAEQWERRLRYERSWRERNRDKLRTYRERAAARMTPEQRELARERKRRPRTPEQKERANARERFRRQLDPERFRSFHRAYGAAQVSRNLCRRCARPAAPQRTRCAWHLGYAAGFKAAKTDALNVDEHLP
ncbi:MAG: hypothetical protein H0W34_00290 [Pyrinomonadaceae bacterium]|nr:hypothetical protein [Pyrinomonadaceae bacterium]